LKGKFFGWYLGGVLQYFVKNNLIITCYKEAIKESVWAKNK